MADSLPATLDQEYVRGYEAGVAEGRRQAFEEALELVGTTQFVTIIPFDPEKETYQEIRHRSHDEIQNAIRAALADTPPVEPTTQESRKDG